MFETVLKLNTYIAVLLLAIFGVTLVPLNVLHHHAEEEHAIAMHSHEVTHHCQLDDYFCQPFDVNCEHNEHLATEITKCFSCDFHFIKHYTKSYQYVCLYKPKLEVTYAKYWANQLKQDTVLLNNKGPPVLA